MNARPESVTSSFSLVRRTPPKPQSAYWEPDAYGHLPLTT